MGSRCLTYWAAAGAKEDCFSFGRDRFVWRLLLYFVLFGTILYAFNLVDFLQSARWNSAVALSAGYGLMVSALLLFRHSYYKGLRLLIVCFYLMGLASFFSNNLLLNLGVYLLGFSVLTAVLTRIKGGVIAFSMNAATLFSAGYLNYSGLYSFFGMHSFSVESWFEISGMLLVINVLLLLLYFILIHRLEVLGKQFKSLAESARDMIWIMDPKGNILYVNPSVHPALGYRPEEWIGSRIADYFPKNRKNDFFKFIGLEAGKTDGPGFISGMLHKNGGRINVEIVPVRKQDKTDKNLICITREMPEETLPEKQTLKEREKALKAKELQTMGVLCGAVAHDLNNILSGLATYPEILLMNENLDLSVRKGLNTIKLSGRQASHIVRDLLDISSGIRPEKEEICINNLIEKYVASTEFQKLMGSFPCSKLTINTDPGLSAITGSYMHIEKSLMNLLFNAVEGSTDNPDPVITIATFNRSLLRKDGEEEKENQKIFSVLRVEDNNRAVNRAINDRFFEPFYLTKEMGSSGTGLGMTLVKMTVENHGGFIETDTTSSGRIFDLFFPSV